MDWIETAKSLRSGFGGNWLPQRLWERISEVERVYLACSGGADSVFLLLWFAEALPADRLTVLHFNHKLRGPESDADEAFVVELCSALQVPLLTGIWDRAPEGGAVSEDAARDARMEFFAQSIGASLGKSVVLTGHHADDVAETLLMRISRGSGLQGMCAPREISEGAFGLKFARPLLKLRKEEIVAGLRDAGASWREDSTNQEDDFFRNRIRSQVIPEWESTADRSVVAGATRTRELLEEDWIALEQVFSEAWEEAEIQRGVLAWDLVSQAPRALQRRMLGRLVSECGNAVPAVNVVDQALESIRAGYAFKFSIGSSGWLEGVPDGEISWLETTMAVEWAAQRLPEGAATFFPGGGKLDYQRVLLGPELRKRILAGEISHGKAVYLSVGEKQSAALGVRLWQPGDVYRPMGRKSVVKLKELFIDRKISREERRTVPIVTGEEGEIIWVPGLPPSRSRLLSETATHALQLTYEG